MKQKKKWYDYLWIVSLTYLICTLFTGHPVRRVFLCATHMSIKENV